MMESLRIFGILLRKNWLVRKRHWIASLIGEIVLPLGFILCAMLFLSLEPCDPTFISTNSIYERHPLDQLIDQIDNSTIPPMQLMYAPSNLFTDELMMKVDQCLQNQISITKFKTEDEVISSFSEQYSPSRTAIIIFDKSTDRSTKHLRYKLRGNCRHLTNLYIDETFTDITHNHWYLLVLTQFCLDKTFIAIKANASDSDIPKLSIQQMPYPAYVKPGFSFWTDFSRQPLATTYIILLVVAFQIPLYIETARVASEKFVGMNVLMSMNGISNTLNLFSWLISGFLWLSLLCAITTLLIFTSDRGNGLTFMNYGNPLIVFIILIAYIAHTITFGIHISAYFSNGLLVTFCITITNMLVMALHICVFESDYLILIPYVGLIFPNVLLHQALQEISSYETLGIQWANIFRDAHLPSRVENSIGGILVISVAGAILHFVLAIYVYSINPGKFGITKHPLLSIMCKNKKRNDASVDSVVYDDKDHEYFEAIPDGMLTAGIQIRNLKKSFNIGLFSKKKVDALRGVSVDLYKGQITSLLGHNGAGKSTLMSILTGLVSPSDGTILVNSKNLKESTCDILKDMGLCTQDNMYFSSLTVTEQLEFLALVRERNQCRSEVRVGVQNLIQKLKLFNVKDALASCLSEDQKRKLCLGMAFVGDPSILVLDEPTSRLDYGSKRDIWEILLEMKGQKTILISTHDMEEADILGDRIAIMQDGRLRSYGTSVYLKKMIGQNNVDVTLSVEEWVNPDSLITKLHRRGLIASEKNGSVIVNIPNSSTVSDYLNRLEKQKEDFGIIGYSISSVSLEQVFLKVTEKDARPPVAFKIITSDKEKLKGFALSLQQTRALFFKKASYTSKNLSTILIQFLTALAALLIVYTGPVIVNFHERQLTVSIEPSSYDNAKILYTSTDQIIGQKYNRFCKSHGGNPIEITNTSLQNELLRRAKEDLIGYNSYVIAAAEFKEIANGTFAANAMYSARALFSLPISVNLIWGAVAAIMLGDDHSISMLIQDLPKTLTSNYQNVIVNPGLIASTAFSIIFNFTIAFFAIHPSQESSRGIKHLQRVTGVHGIIYWGTMLISDLFIYLLIILSVIGGLVCLDFCVGAGLYEAVDIVPMLLLLMLFAINALPIVYIFSFIKTKTQTIMKLLTFIPMSIVTIKFMVHMWTSRSYVNSELHSIFHVLPFMSSLQGLTIIFEMATLNALCRGSCLNMDCNGDCKGLQLSMYYLYIAPAIHCAILVILEVRLIQRVKARCSMKRKEMKISFDEDAQLEKSRVLEKIKLLMEKKSSQRIEMQADNTLGDEIFLAYELGKHYGKVMAVEDVSFGINRGECFGIFGVNGSGKSVTLRLITGQEVLDHGTMYIEDKDFNSSEKCFISQMGYCPQYDVTLKCLNTYEHLRLFARLRGIPEKRLDTEVDVWIDRLKLNSCASLPSSTYSSGNKQRLNIAIALIGNPKLVLLDEPTTRVDPGSRRSFWNTIKSCQLAGQSFLLTSHNMEECEALCEQTAIMLDGKFICVGSPEQLKERFGAGYDLQIRMDSRQSESQVDKIKKDMRLMLHCVLTNENSACLMYHVVGAGTTWRKIYQVMDKLKSKYHCIDDFLLVTRLST